ncbi:MAG: DUF2071 domain-containing protein [Lewinellaceae bacterium]|nr:DUF2071 domain-containing protein [Lewinellaceae bacterium]
MTSNGKNEQPSFLIAAWRRLVLLNYAVEPEALLPYLPAHTELDIWNDTCYVSLVGFMFENTKVRGLKIPFHVNFEEINLRFYVRHNDPVLGWKRGVVFIREIVPKPAIAWVANTLYRERYVARRMWHRWQEQPGQLEVEYGWREGKQWQAFGVQTAGAAMDIKEGSEAEFITEHYWGYAPWDKTRTMEYQVEHPRWQVYPVASWHCQVDYGAAYGPAFADLTAATPKSIFLAKGSAIVVRKGKLLA